MCCARRMTSGNRVPELFERSSCEWCAHRYGTNLRLGEGIARNGNSTLEALLGAGWAEEFFLHEWTTLLQSTR